MFEAQLLPGGVTIFGPWMNRQADNVRCTVEVVALASSPTLEVSLETKNSEDAGDGQVTGGPTLSASSVGRVTDEWDSQDLVNGGSTGLLELVRYKYVTIGDSTDWVLFRMLNPNWFDSVKA
jgi:hypothetical protein